MRKFTITAALAILAFLSFTTAVFAGGAVTPEDSSLLDLAKPVYDAVMGGQYWLAASFALVLVVAAFKRYAPGRAGEWARTDLGGSLLVLLASFGGALATGLLAVGTNAMTLALAFTALKVAFGAAGGYALIKKILVPILRRVAEKVPAWMKPIFTVALWAFESHTPVAVAEKAGDEAVKNNPAEGANGVVGEPTDI